MQSIGKQILKRICGKGRGSVFIPKDFLDLGSRAAVDQALSRLVRDDKIRRVARGVYDYPRVSPRLGRLSPAPDAVADAIAKNTDSRIQVSGAHAANLLGLSTQVPARLVYLTDGASRRVRLGNQVIEFRHAAPRWLVGCGKVWGVVLQALRYLGTHGVDDDVAQKLSRTLSAKDKDDLKLNIAHFTDWMTPLIHRIAHAT